MEPPLQPLWRAKRSAIRRELRLLAEHGAPLAHLPDDASSSDEDDDGPGDAAGHAAFQEAACPRCSAAAHQRSIQRSQMSEILLLPGP